MNEMTLPKVVIKRPKRLGRGYGSGKGGHTSSRGQKGQKVRNKIPLLFEGYKTKKSLLRRLPQLRGKGKFKAGKKPIIVQISKLNQIKADKITLVALYEAGLIDLSYAKKHGVKIIGKSKMEKKWEINVPMSKGSADSFGLRLKRKQNK